MSELNELKNKVEAVLFSAGRVVSLPELCRICNVKDPSAAQEAVEVLKQEMDQRNSPLLLTAEADGWKMTIHERYLPVVHHITPQTELSKALLETLAVIAWKQPILQSDVIKMRTSAAYEHVAELLKLGFINKNRQGRSYVLKVTGKFFDYFDLPGHEALKEQFKQVQGAEEMQKLLGEQTTLGELEVYPVAPQLIEEQKSPAADNLGELEVYDVKRPHHAKPKIPGAEEQKGQPQPEESADVTEIAKRILTEPEPEETEPEQSQEEEHQLNPELEDFAEKRKGEEPEEEQNEESETHSETEEPEEKKTIDDV